jgi:hypothetical protein
MADLNEVHRQAAMAAGRFAAEHGHPATDCPHPVDGHPHDRALANAWMREYLRHHPDAADKAVNYTD